MKKFLLILILFNSVNFIFADDLNNSNNFDKEENFVFIKNFQIVEDVENKNAKLKFNNNDNNIMYIWRSYHKNSDFKIIGYSDNMVFNDNGTEPGIQYWYKIGFIKGGNADYNENNLINYTKEFHKKIIIKGKDFNKVLAEKKENNFVIKNKEKKALNLLKKYYTHPVKLFFVFNTIKFYIKKHEVMVLNDYDKYDINYKDKILTVYNYDKNYIFKLHSKKIFRCLKKIKNNKHIFDRLIKNSIAFVIKKSEKLVIFDNYNKYIPTFEAIGIATLYFKNDRNWKNNTIIFGTSDKKLKRKLNKIQGKYNKSHQNHY